MNLYLLIVWVSLLTIQSSSNHELAYQSQLAQYNAAASSSSFGEPIFRLEPPSSITFLSSQGATIPCLVSGSPQPTISWYSSWSAIDTANGQTGSTSGEVALQQSRLVDNVTNIRQIVQNGAAIRLLPFKEADFRQDIHSTEYRCVASNYLATIHSRSVLVQAVVTNDNTGEQADQVLAKVSDEFVELNSLAVLKCRPSNGADLHFLIEWFTSDGLQIKASETTPFSPNNIRGNKFTAFKSGELHINEVDTSDLQRTYGCRLANSATGRHVSSSGTAQLILAADGSAPTRTGSGTEPLLLLHSASQLIGDDTSAVQPTTPTARAARQRWLSSQPLESPAWRLLVPCALRALPPGHSISWLYQASATERPVPLHDWAASRSLVLLQVEGAKLEQVNNGAGHWLNASAAARRPAASKADQGKQQAATRFVLGPSYLAIEWPTSAQSGRYICQLVRQGSGDERASVSTRTLCDTNVIIRRPIELGVELASPVGPSASGLVRHAQQVDDEADASLIGRAATWLGWRHRGTSRLRRKRSNGGRLSEQQSGSLLDTEPQRLQLRGPGSIAAPPVVQVGQLLRLECRARGHPIESVRWFRNGELISAQSANDFQVEISEQLSGATQPQGDNQTDDDDLSDERQTDRGNLSGQEDPDRLISALIVRQLQAKEAGLSVFECFAQNSLGDRARAGKLVFVAERTTLEAARASCPLQSNESQPEVEESDNLFSMRASVYSRAASIFSKHNPILNALVLESEPVEMRCLCALSEPSGDTNATAPQYRQVEWRRWRQQESAGTKQMTEAAFSTSISTPTPTANRNFNQLFSGDSRFVINGSSLQIRSPSGRHDEALYVCKSGANLVAQSERIQADRRHQQSSSVAASYSSSQLLGQAYANGQLHQSSSASSISYTSGTAWSSCNALLLANLFQDELAAWQQRAASPPMSSISIRIVAKPKIDPFEFSRNLEEGMRAAVACVVISGQSPVDIRWFKNGQLLLADSANEAEQKWSGSMSIDQTNGFSSTLTFHRIRPAHSGSYTCVAANAFAATNHTSQLVVNVAPYFVEPPKNAQAILGTNLLVNCRAAGQPSPQIRWRKLVSLANGSGGKLVAPAGGNSLQPPGKLNLIDLLGGEQFDSSQQHQAAAQSLGSNGKLEFRVITSNSHIQVLENGSMIIKDVELNDASRYVCQAFNGINPSLSEAIDVKVLSPAEFDINYETVSVKRDSMIKFNCAPKGDQPMQIEWRKEGQLLVPSASQTGQQQPLDTSAGNRLLQSGKYSEIVHYYAPMTNSSSSAGVRLASSDGQSEPVRQKHHNLAVQVNAGPQLHANQSDPVRSSELFIEYADRGDTGAFVCTARNSYGKDELTYRLIVQEAPDVPPNLSVQSVQATSVKLAWSAPFDGNLPISHFVVEHRKVNLAGQLEAAGHSEWTRLVTSTSKLEAADKQQPAHPAPGAGTAGAQFSVVLRQLTPKSAYHVRVAAVNAIGQSGFSPYLTMSTAEEPPSSGPNDLRSQPVSSSAIKVLWRGPVIVDEQAPVRGYYVSHRKLQPVPAGGSANKTAVEGSGAASVAQSWLATVSVSAANSSSAAGADASDGPFGTRGGVAAKEQQTLNSKQARKNHLTAGANYELIVGQLERNTKYEIRVQPYNSMGVGPASEAVGQTLRYDRPNQPNLKLVAARKQSFELKWTLSGADQQPLMGFSLFYKCEYDDWQEIQLGTIQHYVIENLRCGNKYQIYLVAFNAVGRSEPSEVLSVRTEGTVPVAPDKSQFVVANITEIVLDMSAWQSGGCPISSFMVQFKRLHESNWFILSEGPTPFANSDKITIPDLAPASWYKLLVTALNEAGSTNAQYLFSTLTLTGDEVMPNFAEHELGADAAGHQQGHQTGWLTAGGAGSLSIWNKLVQALFGLSSPGNSGKSQMALPMSFIALVLVFLFASYLYYSRSSATSSPSSTSGSSDSSSSDSAGQRTGSGVPKNPPTNGYHLHHGTNGTMSMLGRSPSVVMNRLQSCAATTTLGARRLDEKQLIQSSQHLNQNYLMSPINSLPLDGSPQQHQQHLERTSNSMLDTLIGSAGLQSFISGAMSGNQSHAFNQLNGAGKHELEQGSHHLRLLSSGNLFANTPQQSLAGTSSISTHTTNCLDGSSSQASSSGTSSAGAKAKLQLIDESSMISGAIDETQELLANGNQQQVSQQNWQHAQCLYGTADQEMLDSPSRALYAGFAPQAIDFEALNQNQRATINNAAQFGANLFRSTQDETGRQQFYNASEQNGRLLASASFASGADLAQRQQQQQQICQQQAHLNEPIYQRLDKFQSFGLPVCKQQASIYSNQAIKAQTLRFNAHSNNAEQCFKSATLQRAPNQLEQHQMDHQKHYLMEQSALNQQQHCLQQQHLAQQAHLTDGYHEQQVGEPTTSESGNQLQQQQSSTCNGLQNDC